MVLWACVWSQVLFYSSYYLSPLCSSQTIHGPFLLHGRCEITPALWALGCQTSSSQPFGLVIPKQCYVIKLFSNIYTEHMSRNSRPWDCIHGNPGLTILINLTAQVTQNVITSEGNGLTDFWACWLLIWLARLSGWSGQIDWRHPNRQIWLRRMWVAVYQNLL